MAFWYRMSYPASSSIESSNDFCILSKLGLYSSSIFFLVCYSCFANAALASSI